MILNYNSFSQEKNSAQTNILNKIKNVKLEELPPQYKLPRAFIDRFGFFSQPFLNIIITFALIARKLASIINWT